MLLTFAAALLACAVGAFPGTSQPHVLHERRSFDPPQWIKRDDLRDIPELPIRIWLAQSNLDIGPDLLLDISDPRSSNYGKHYSQQEVIDLFAPSDDTLVATREWLASAGVRHVEQSCNKQWLQFNATMEEIEELLSTKYYLWENTVTGGSQVACDEYRLPKNLINHIDYVTPGINLMSVSQIEPPSRNQKRSRRRELTLSNDLCHDDIRPSCIRTMYNITEGNFTSGYKNALGLLEMGYSHYDQADLDSFWKETGIPIGTRPVPALITGERVVDDEYEYDYDNEAIMDLILSIPLVYPQEVVVLQVDEITERIENLGYTFDDFFNTVSYSECKEMELNESVDGLPGFSPSTVDSNDFEHQLHIKATDLTDVISVSYGEPESPTPRLYQLRQCYEAMKLGLRGVTIVVASGDHGVASLGENNTEFCFGQDSLVFAPLFPAACPWVTTVGGTRLPNWTDPAKDQEIATTAFASGGGFSNIHSQPSWQKATTDSWFERYAPPYPFYDEFYNLTEFDANGGLWRRIGRGYPDVAAVGQNIAMYAGGKRISEAGGTSASAPIFASIITRINIERRAAGKRPVGFVNPTLYANPQIFHDITSGNNPGCGTDGFNATFGWDPVTGLGTPNYPAMLDLFMSLP